MRIRIVVLLAALFTLALTPRLANAQTEDELLDICGALAGSDATYLRDFKVRLEASDPPQIQRYPIILKKGNK